VPTYQYQCTACGEDLEAVQRFTDEPLTVCPSCQGKLRKVYSSVGVVFKGSGFYRTDSRTGGSGSDGSSGSGGEKKKSGDSSSSGSSTSSGSSGASSSSSGSSGSSGSVSSSSSTAA
jgi:putative FmdB family regulatory protein